MNSSFQPSLPNLRVTMRSPLIGMNGASAMLRMSSEEVDALVELGFLVAFEISVNPRLGDGSRHDPRSRREMRFVVESVNYYQKARGTHSFELEWPQLFALIVPHEKPFIMGTEIDAALVCDPDHRLNLIRAGHLKTTGGASRTGNPWRPGRNGAPAITRDSFEQFLKARQL